MQYVLLVVQNPIPCIPNILSLTSRNQSAHFFSSHTLACMHTPQICCKSQMNKQQIIARGFSARNDDDVWKTIYFLRDSCISISDREKCVRFQQAMYRFLIIVLQDGEVRAPRCTSITAHGCTSPDTISAGSSPSSFFSSSSVRQLKASCLMGKICQLHKSSQ